MNGMNSLSAEAKRLLNDSMAELDARYDEESGLLRFAPDKALPDSAREVRASAHYALGLLLRGEMGDARRADRVIHAVLDTQYDAPDQIYHGTFRRSPNEPTPPRLETPWQEISPAARYAADCAWERIEEGLLTRMAQNRETSEHQREALSALRAARGDAVPVVWQSYDPNWREFVLCALALALACFSLPPDTASRIARSARLALDGAVARYRMNLTPLNTNIEIMHVFVCDFFGQRLGDAALRDHALACAERFQTEYAEFHAIHEFNSPTYMGVALTAIGFWRKFAPSPRVRALGRALEAALWEDFAQFYHPLMENLCGPFSRNYDMDMRVHTSLHALLYLGLGEARFARPALNCESDHNPLLALTGVEIPPHVADALLHFRGERTLLRRFRELSERGDPSQPQAVCTATGWMNETLMTGALSGSRNVSGQLHPLVVYWRDRMGGVSSLRLRRFSGLGENEFLHTVFINATAQKNRITASVRIDVRRDIDVIFEWECGDCGDAAFTPDHWILSGLTVKVAAQAPVPRVQRTDASHLRVVYACAAEDDANKTMSFDLTFQR